MLFSRCFSAGCEYIGLKRAVQSRSGCFNTSDFSPTACRDASYFSGFCIQRILLQGIKLGNFPKRSPGGVKRDSGSSGVALGLQQNLLDSA